MRPCHCCRGDEIAAGYSFKLIAHYISMIGAVFILRILQNGLLVSCSVGYHISRITIHSLGPVSKWSQHPERIKKVGGNSPHACRWSYICIGFRKLLSSKLDSEEHVFIWLSLLLRQSLHHAILMMEHVIVHGDNMLQFDCMPLRHPKGQILTWPQYLHDILDYRPFILSCELQPVFTIF